MGGVVSTGVDNDELVDKLKAADYIKSPEVEKVFRVVDRGYYLTPDCQDAAYRDNAWKSGNLHMSAPCIYAQVLEGLELKSGMSFLNLGSGTGYLSTMAGLIIGSYGVNHGVELHEEVVLYAKERLQWFITNSGAVDCFHFSEPQFFIGNVLSMDYVPQYDRVYCGASCPALYEAYMKAFIKVGGILVMPQNDKLVKIKRTGLDTYITESLIPVSFASLVLPQSDTPSLFFNCVNVKDSILSLQEICRLLIRSTCQSVIDGQYPNLSSDFIHKVTPTPLNRIRTGRSGLRFSHGAMSFDDELDDSDVPDEYGGDEETPPRDAFFAFNSRLNLINHNQLAVFLEMAEAFAASSSNNVDSEEEDPHSSNFHGFSNEPETASSNFRNREEANKNPNIAQNSSQINSNLEVNEKLSNKLRSENKEDISEDDFVDCDEVWERSSLQSFEEAYERELENEKRMLENKSSIEVDTESKKLETNNAGLDNENKELETNIMKIEDKLVNENMEIEIKNKEVRNENEKIETEKMEVEIEDERGSKIKKVEHSIENEKIDLGQAGNVEDVVFNYNIECNDRIPKIEVTCEKEDNLENTGRMKEVLNVNSIIEKNSDKNLEYYSSTDLPESPKQCDLDAITEKVSELENKNDKSLFCDSFKDQDKIARPDKENKLNTNFREVEKFNEINNSFSETGMINYETINESCNDNEVDKLNESLNEVYKLSENNQPKENFSLMPVLLDSSSKHDNYIDTENISSNEISPENLNCDIVQTNYKNEENRKREKFDSGIVEDLEQQFDVKIEESILEDGDNRSCVKGRLGTINNIYEGESSNCLPYVLSTEELNKSANADETMGQQNKITFNNGEKTRLDGVKAKHTKISSKLTGENRNYRRKLTSYDDGTKNQSDSSSSDKDELPSHTRDATNYNSRTTGNTTADAENDVVMEDVTSDSSEKSYSSDSSFATTSEPNVRSSDSEIPPVKIGKKKISYELIKNSSKRKWNRRKETAKKKKIVADTNRIDSKVLIEKYTKLMGEKINNLPLPIPLKIYVNYCRPLPE